MPFINLTTFESNIRIAVNTDNVTHIAANGVRSKVHFASGDQLHVNEPFDNVLVLLPGYVAPVAVTDATVDVAATSGEDAAASGAAADAANPAKSRQTK